MWGWGKPGGCGGVCNGAKGGLTRAGGVRGGWLQETSTETRNGKASVRRGGGAMGLGLIGLKLRGGTSWEVGGEEEGEAEAGQSATTRE
jgi:hypothetical protein